VADLQGAITRYIRERHLVKKVVRFGDILTVYAFHSHLKQNYSLLMIAQVVLTLTRSQR
jgi:hypothetical protein